MIVLKISFRGKTDAVLAQNTSPYYTPYHSAHEGVSMTTTVIFSVGEPKIIVLHQGQSIDSNTEQRLARRDPDLRTPISLQDLDEAAILSSARGNRVIRGTVSGELLDIPKVESITYISSLGSRER